MNKKIGIALVVVLGFGLSFAIGVQAAGDRNGGSPSLRPEAKVGSSTKSGMPPTAQSSYAIIRRDGTKVRAFNWDDSDRLGLGAYEVFFKQRVDFCSYSATIGDPTDGEEDPGFITVAIRFGTTDGVFVATYDTNGNPADRAFHLVVNC